MPADRLTREQQLALTCTWQSHAELPEHLIRAHHDPAWPHWQAPWGGGTAPRCETR